MILRAAADFLVVTHALFVAFVVLGGLLVARWPRVAWLHVPSAVWGALSEYSGWICPRTPLEISLRLRSGSPAYAGDFIEHCLLPILCPARLTPAAQIGLGTGVVLINVLLYWRAFRRERPSRRR